MSMSVYDSIQPYPVFSQSPVSNNISAFTELDMCCAKDSLPFLNATCTKKDTHQESESRVSA